MVRVGTLGQLLLLGMVAHGSQAAQTVDCDGLVCYFGGSGGAAERDDVSNGGAQGTILVGRGGGIGVFTVPRTSLATDEDSTGWRGLAGYRFNRYLAAELEYLDFGTSEDPRDLRARRFPAVPLAALTIEQDFKTGRERPGGVGAGKTLRWASASSCSCALACCLPIRRCA